jgi:hypothetical protein
LKRTFAIRFPLYQAKFESNRLVWSIVSVVMIVGVLLNAWVPLSFEPTKYNENSQYCDVAKDYRFAYFNITILYIALTMLIPIVLIFVCNSIIMIYIAKASSKRAFMSNAEITTNRKHSATRLNPTTGTSPPSPPANGSEDEILLDKGQSTPIIVNNIAAVEVAKPRLSDERRKAGESPSPERGIPSVRATRNIHAHSRLPLTTNIPLNVSGSTKRNASANDSVKITRMLLFMSFSYAVLNLPYFVSWCIFFYKMAFDKEQMSAVNKNYLFATIQFSEMFYVLNYGVHFFIYCFSGQRFRTLLKSAFSKK